MPDLLHDLGAQKTALVETLWGQTTAKAWCKRHTAILDEAIVRLCNHLESEIADPLQFAVIATGGFGRSELGPQSDLDIGFLPISATDPKLEDQVRRFFHYAQTNIPATFGIQVGYSFLTPADVPGLSEKILSSLLDARILWGDPTRLDAIMEAFWNHLDVGQFLVAKLKERANDYARTHDTPLVVEPALKEGAGGLRDFQCANWLREAVGERARKSPPEYDVVLLERCRLQALSGIQSGPLTRARREEIVRRLGTDIQLWSDRLGHAMLTLHEEFKDARLSIRNNRFTLSPHVLALGGELRFTEGVTLGEAAVGIATGQALGLDVRPLKTTFSPEVRGYDLTGALSSGEPVLRALDQAGVLSALLPELEACRTLLPNDPSHRYTVFEHTLQAIRIFDALPPDDFWGDLKAHLTDPEPLILALLLHDTGKALDGHHEITGEALAHTVCQRWQVPPDVAATVPWLVRNHLELAKITRTRDVMHPDTAAETATWIGDVNRLVLLTLLTYCDTKAVGPDVLNPIQESFLITLFERTRTILDPDTLNPDNSRVRSLVKRDLRDANADEASLNAFVESLPAYYLLTTPSETIKEHFSFVQRASNGEIVIEHKHHHSVQVTDLTISLPDRPGVLREILGVLYAHNLTLHGLRAGTTRSTPPIVLDIVTVSESEHCLGKERLRALRQDLTDILSKSADTEALLKRLGKDPDRRQEIVRWTFQPGNPGILEVRAPKGRGLGFRLSSEITARGWNILSARFGSWAGQGSAAFYVNKPDGTSISREEVADMLDK